MTVSRDKEGKATVWCHDTHSRGVTMFGKVVEQHGEIKTAFYT